MGGEVVSLSEDEKESCEGVSVKGQLWCALVMVSDKKSVWKCVSCESVQGRRSVGERRRHKASCHSTHTVH